jgi:hypothetical protein
MNVFNQTADKMNSELPVPLKYPNYMSLSTLLLASFVEIWSNLIAFRIVGLNFYI